MSKSTPVSLREQLRVPPDPSEARTAVAEARADATPGAPGGKKKSTAALGGHASALGDLQERLYAGSKGGDPRRVLVVLQGMDTSGKGGVIRHVFGLVDPQGLALRAFKAPTAQEQKHDFLWRVENAVPSPGMIGIFDRSHYEDVLIARVHDLVPPAEWEKRYAAINRFEARLVRDDVTIVKCFLNVSFAQQRERLLARLEDATKHWKYNPGDIDERGYWAAYQDAYSAALSRCNAGGAPWYVIPSDHKWYRNWAIGQILLETLTELDPQYPRMDFDVEAETTRLGETA